MNMQLSVYYFIKKITSTPFTFAVSRQVGHYPNCDPYPNNYYRVVQRSLKIKRETFDDV